MNATRTTTRRFRAAWVPQSSGSCYCPGCGNLCEDLGQITLAGLCVGCAAKADPSPTAHLRTTDPFWLLTPEEIDQAGVQLQYLHRKHRQLERTLPERDWLEAELPVLDEMKAIEREATVLQMLVQMSRQFGGTT